ncbi:hypothetical protein GCM10023212_11740 [Luteolibacter yonseiensis]
MQAQACDLHHVLGPLAGRTVDTRAIAQVMNMLKLPNWLHRILLTVSSMPEPPVVDPSCSHDEDPAALAGFFKKKTYVAVKQTEQKLSLLGWLLAHCIMQYTLLFLDIT